MQRTRLALEIVFGTLAVVVVSMCLTYAWPDKEYGLSGWMQAVAGWAQAVGSILAILAAGKIATAQSRRQFEDARRLQRIDQAHAAFTVAKSTIEIAASVRASFRLVIEEYGHDRAIVSLIAERQNALDRQVLTEMRADLDAIPLHELPSSRLVAELLAMRSIIQRATSKIGVALDEVRTMDSSDFQAFFDYLDRAYKDFSDRLDETERIADSILSEIRELGR